MTQFTTYIIKLAAEPNSAAEFRKDPDAAIRAAGLTSEQGAALKSKDPSRISAEIQKEHPDTGAAVGISITFKLVI
jgi:hypothetical protein